MKKTVKLLMSISLCMCLMMTLFSFNIHAAGNDNVKLYYARTNTTFRERGEFDSWTTEGKIAVKDLGNDANVVVHFSYDGGKTWQDVPAAYLKKSSDGYDIYDFETPKYSWSGHYYYSYHCIFAIKYEVNGQTYWDNNNGQNYSIGYSNVAYYKNIILNKSKLLYKGYNDYFNNVFKGDIVINDNADSVTVKYKTNESSTYKEVKAYRHPYVPYDNMNKLENWVFELNEDVDIYEFIIEYEKNGCTYIDNNFDENYIINTADLPERLG